MMVTIYNKTAEDILGIPLEDILYTNLFETCKAHNINLNLNRDDFFANKRIRSPLEKKFIVKNNENTYQLMWEYLYDNEEKSSWQTLFIIGIKPTPTSEKAQSDNSKLAILETIIDNLPEYVYWKDRNLVYTGGNRNMLTRLGTTSMGKIIDKNDCDFGYSKKQAREIHAADKKILGNGLNISEKTKLCTKENIPPLTLLTRKSPLKDKNGNIIGIIGISTDITEKIDTQKKNNSYKQTLDTIIENIPGIVYWKDKEGYYLGCNNSFLALSKLSSQKQVIGKTDFDLIWKENAHEYRKNDLAVMTTGQAMHLEESLTLPNSTKRFFTSIKTPLFNKYGEIIGIIGTSVDITTRKELARKLQKKAKEYEYTLETLIQNIPGEIYWKDREGCYLGCNSNFVKLAGATTPEEIIGKKDAALIWANDEKMLRENDLLVMKTGKKQSLEEEVKHTNGETGLFSVIKAPLRNEKGEIIGIVGTSMDITYRQKARETLEKAKIMEENASTAKSELIANMSHDLRTPLSGIMGLAHLTSESLNNTDLCQQNLQDIERAAAQLINMANNILNASSLEIGMDTVTLEPFSLQNTVDEIVTMLMPAIRDKGLSCQVKLSTELPPALCSDSSIIFRMLLNLLSNALKFTDHGWIAIRAQLITTDDPHAPQLELVIADSGKGIPKEALKTIFEAFKRLTPSYKSAYHGAGLGLYMVKKLLTNLNGQIKVESQVDKGSTFTLTFPVTIADESELPKEKPATMDSTFVSLAYSRNTRQANRQKKGNGAAMKAISANKLGDANKFFTLVVEDSKITQHVIIAYLERFNCQIETAETLASAQQMATEKRYDLILADIGLPDGNGNDLAKQIRQDPDSPNHKTPIVALTAHVTEAYKKCCLDAGMQYVLYKPLTPNKIEALFEALWQKDTTAPANATEKTVTATVAADIIHFDSILAITANNYAKAKELLAMVINSFTPEQQQMQHAYDQEDWHQLRKVVHKMHGAVGFYGLNRLKQHCRALDQQLLTGTSKTPTTVNKAEITPLYQQMLQSIEATQAAWQTLKQQKISNNNQDQVTK
ncbi:MAG: PAS domain-containing protein [Gammaproteobacteria bacterium]|nr:PAS domain-containing protein [Gammaproteobacteria bacterium]